MKDWYYYLHTNGDLIGKNPFAVNADPHYFDSPFVKRVWHIDLEDRSDAWKLILEALALGADNNRIGELVAKWELDLKDAAEMMQRVTPSASMIKGMPIFTKTFLNMDFDTFLERIKPYFKEFQNEGGKP